MQAYNAEVVEKLKAETAALEILKNTNYLSPAAQVKMTELLTLKEHKEKRLKDSQEEAQAREAEQRAEVESYKDLLSNYLIEQAKTYLIRDFFVRVAFSF